MREVEFLFYSGDEIFVLLGGGWNAFLEVISIIGVVGLEEYWVG